MSYPAICEGFPSQYQVIQISPHTPDTFLRPQQPTTWDIVRPSQAGRCRDLHPFTHDRVSLVAQVPVSVSPNHLIQVDWVEERISPPSALRNVASPIRGTTLQRLPLFDWQSIGVEVASVSGVGGPGTFIGVCGVATLSRIALKYYQALMPCAKY